MAIMTPDQRNNVINALNVLKKNDKTLRDMQEHIEGIFGLTLSLKTISQYVNKTEREVYLKKLKEDNEKVNSWIRQCDPEKIVNQTESLAEDLWETFKKHAKNFE